MASPEAGELAARQLEEALASKAAEHAAEMQRLRLAAFEECARAVEAAREEVESGAAQRVA